MLRFALRVSIPVLLITASFQSFSQSNWPKTLLWRITGKDLSKPSYLYGTMHLQDKRLFQFGDSLYHALEQTDGFAMEIDANEMMDSVITNSLREAEEELFLERQKVRLNRKKLNKSADSLLRSYGIKGDVATKKDLKKIRDGRMAKLLKQGEMPTIVDAYLMGMARRMKKWTGGIEDVNDQLNLSDELGGALDPESVLVEEALLRTSIEQMISVYLAQDLDKIDEISNRSYSGEDKDLMLTKRNVKMAYRMDSLSHVRSMFFAVGAAHLPGDSGVIKLLRSHGYTVEPVYSSAQIPADAYSAKLQKVEWVDVEGLDGSYAIKMPGQPTDHDMLGDLIKMKVYFDMTTMSFYMSGSITAGKIDTEKLDEMMSETLQNMTGKKASLKGKTINRNGLLGKEGVAENQDGVYRIQLLVKDNTVFMLMVGGMKKTSIHSADADQFFASFVPGNTAVKKSEWETFQLKDKAFSVRLPGKPSLNEAIDKEINASESWRSVSYNMIDGEKGFFYLVQVKEIQAGSFLGGDSAYFASLMEDYKARVDEVLQMEVSQYQGYPALYMDGYLKEANAVYKTLHVTRGNRVYSLLAGAPKGNDMSDADMFLKSLTLEPYEPAVFSMQGSDGFYTSAPAPFVKLEKDSTEATYLYSAHYVSYDAKEATSYDVFVDAFSPTYWVENDSTYFMARVQNYTGYNDSVLKKEWVQNGGVKGIDMLVQMPGYNSLKKVRMLVSGDSIYTLFAMIPAKDIDKAYHQAFFNDFRVVNELPPTIYTSKASQLLQALQTSDSLAFEDAKENLGIVSFGKQDLPLLHQAILANYKDSSDYGSVSSALVSIVSELADSTSIRFVEEAYPLLGSANAVRQYNLLSLLAKIKTRESYAVLKNFLLTDLPASEDAWRLQFSLYDSLELTATLYPELLEKADDSLFGYAAIVLANQLLDSGQLTQAVARQYEKQILRGARAAVKTAKEDEKEVWKMANWASMLSHINSAEGNALLQEVLLQKDIYIKQHVILALLKNNQPVKAAEINKVAADKSARGGFYEELQKLKKEQLFPALYGTQKSLAESELYAYLEEEWGEFTLTYIGERVEVYAGKKQRFYLFKAGVDNEEENEKHYFLAVAGPYELNAKEKKAFADASGIYTGEEFRPEKVNKLLKDYLKEMTPAEE